jgi:hypothetical protein
MLPKPDNGGMADRDKRAKYRHLPPTIDPADTADTVASVDTDRAAVENSDGWDPNEGAGPYLRAVWGPWVR